MSGAVIVRGVPTAEEVAAVVAVLTRRDPAPPVSPLERWRQARQALLRP